MVLQRRWLWRGGLRRWTRLERFGRSVDHFIQGKASILDDEARRAEKCRAPRSKSGHDGEDCPARRRKAILHENAKRASVMPRRRNEAANVDHGSDREHNTERREDVADSVSVRSILDSVEPTGEQKRECPSVRVDNK